MLLRFYFLAFTFKFLFPFTLKYFSAMELFFVNSVGMPFNSGSIIAGILMLAAFYLGLHFSPIRRIGLPRTLLILSVLFIVIGFSSWLMLPIQSQCQYDDQRKQSF
jgi:hypothetical protein